MATPTNPIDPLAIIKMSLESNRARVIAKAYDLARDLAEAAKALHRAAENFDLDAIIWTGKTYNVELATRADDVREMLHLVASLEAKKS